MFFLSNSSFSSEKETNEVELKNLFDNVTSIAEKKIQNTFVSDSSVCDDFILIRESNVD